MARKQAIKDEVKGAIFSLYPDSGMFNAHFNDAYNKVPENTPKDAIINIVITSMQAMLDNYAKTTAKTRGGKVGRFFAKVGSKILPFVKFIKIKK
jgi:hypothetical protein